MKDGGVIQVAYVVRDLEAAYLRMWEGRRESPPRQAN